MISPTTPTYIEWAGRLGPGRGCVTFSGMSTAALLVIGNEILSGKVRDTNSAYLSVELRKLGVDLERILTIPDLIDIIAEETLAMSEDYDFVFTSGGIGPTHDDLTMDGIAKAFDLELVLNPSMVDRMSRHAKAPLNEAMKKMALIPGGAEVLDVGGLWFPVVVVKNVYIFPGIPELFEKKFDSIRERFSGVPFQLTRIFVRENESEIAEILNALLREFPALMLGSYPKINEPEFRVLLTLESRDSEYLKRATETLLSQLPTDAVHKIE
jgi:molybdenum cofactor synthesis domain-containing protein